MTKNILITGVASGIGKAAADVFLDNGYAVFGIDISLPEGKDGMRTFIADVTEERSIYAIADRLREESVTLDAIVNVAGIHRMQSLVEGEYGRMKRLIDVNLTGTMLINRAFHPLLKADGRVIIVTSEVASFDPMPFNGLYNVSKTALECYAQALRQELNLIGQRVITIRPGAIETPLSQGSLGDTASLAENTELYKKQAGKFLKLTKTFMGKPMKAEKLAPTIYHATVCDKPRLVYKKHRNLGLILLNLLPIKMQCAVIKLLLNR